MAGEIKMRRDHAACSGCSLCLLVCPSWRRSRDLRLTPHGRFKALQHGATLADLVPAIADCSLCGACEPICPENIDVVDAMLGLRRQLPQTIVGTNLNTAMQDLPPRPLFGPAPTDVVLLAPATYKWRPHVTAAIREVLGGPRYISIEQDGGADIALALEVGAPIPDERLDRFLAPLKLRKTIIVADGLLQRSLRQWLPHAHIVSIGWSLSSLPSVRDALGPGDLYVIEPRAFHLDHANLVRHYDELRAATGCTLNLDLNRMAIPARAHGLACSLGFEKPHDTAQIRWLLKGRRIRRVIVECELDRAAFERECRLPVFHAAEVEPVVPDPLIDSDEPVTIRTGN